MTNRRITVGVIFIGDESEGKVLVDPAKESINNEGQTLIFNDNHCDIDSRFLNWEIVAQ